MTLTWIPVALVAYLLLAGVQIMDRFIVRQAVPDPIAYGFAVGIATGLVLPVAAVAHMLPAIPFTFMWPGTAPFLLALLAGSIFLLSLIPFFGALQDGEASRVVPAEGGLTTVFTFTLAAVFLGEVLTLNTLAAFALLFVGYIFVTLQGPVSHLWRSIDWRIALSAVLLAISFVLRRDLFPEDDFNGFLSMFLLVTAGMTLTAIGLLLIPNTRRRILAVRKKASQGGNVLLVLLNQAGGAVSGFLINYAISLGPVALVQAAQASQYVFIFILALLLSRKFPAYFEEVFTRKVITQKIIGTGGVAAGLAVLMLTA